MEKYLYVQRKKKTKENSREKGTGEELKARKAVVVGKKAWKVESEAKGLGKKLETKYPESGVEQRMELVARSRGGKARQSC